MCQGLTHFLLSSSSSLLHAFAGSGWYARTRRGKPMVLQKNHFPPTATLSATTDFLAHADATKTTAVHLCD